MARAVRAAALLALVAALWPGARAEAGAAVQALPAPQLLEPFAGRTVAAIRLFVEETPTENPALLSLIDAPIGQPLSIAAVRESEQRLSRLPYYEGAVATAEGTPDGRVVLTFRLEPRHPIDALAFELTAPAAVAPADLDRRVREQYFGLPAGDRQADVDETVRELLAEEGYRAARVTSERVLRHDPDRATLRFVIDPGPRTIISNVQVNGRSPYPVTEILQRTGAVDGAPYREREIETRLGALRDELSGKGYYAAVAQQLPEFLPDAAVALTLVVEAGPVVELSVEPPGALPPGGVEAYIPIRSERAVDDDLLDDSRARITNALQREGYINSQVSYRRDQPSPDRLLIVFTVERGRRHRVDRIVLPPDLVVPPAPLLKLVGLSPRDVLNVQALQAGIARIVGEYRSRGYFEAEVTEVFEEGPGRSPAAEAWVAVRLDVTEGPRAVISEVTFDLGESPTVPAGELRPVLQSQPGSPYVDAVVAADRRRLAEEYSRRGFDAATVEIQRVFSEDRTVAALTITAREGPRLIVREIIVVGNERIDTDQVLREITLRTGAPLSDEARFESRRRLLATGSYRNVTITPEPPPPGETAVRVIVAVEEAPATAVGFGGGLEMRRRPRSAAGGGVADRFEVAPRAFFEVGRRNVGGRNRSVSFFSRISLQPTNAPGDPSRDGKGIGFAEYRATVTYREQNAFRTDSDLLLGVTSEQAVRTTFNFVRQSANAELLHRLTPAVSLSARYALEFNRLFDERFADEEQLLVDRVFPEVRLSLFAGGLFWDRRDSPLSPTTGTLFVADHEVALRQIGSEVGFVKSFYQLSFYRPMSANRRTVLAMRGQFGAARGFERAVPVRDDTGQPVFDEEGRPVTDVISDLPASHRFFAGGSTTVRGFQLDRLGVEEILNEDGLSNGGHGLVLTNVEVRTIVGRLMGRSLAVAGFADGGNVFARARDFDLGRLRGALGVGLRYDSPLGPLRFDVGFKVRRLTFAAGRERGWEYHLSIGEAF
jgi:outer membrane protein assembly complex protein YaeT